MRKILIALTTLAFAAATPVVSSTAFAKSACDPVANASACKSTVHKKAPKKAAPAKVVKKKKKKIVN